jgi:hypothetical protein
VSGYWKLSWPHFLCPVHHFHWYEIYLKVQRIETHSTLFSSSIILCTISRPLIYIQVDKLNALNCELSAGTTVVVALIYSGRLYVANVGDSRALLCRTDSNGVLRVIQLSVDHDLSNEDELLRLSQLGLDVDKFRQGNQYYFAIHILLMWPPLLSSDQSSWPRIQRSRVWFSGQGLRSRKPRIWP